MHLYLRERHIKPYLLYGLQNVFTFYIDSYFKPNILAGLYVFLFSITFSSYIRYFSNDYRPSTVPNLSLAAESLIR